MIGKPTKEEKKKFKSWLEKNRNIIHNRNISTFKVILNHIINDVINKYKYRNDFNLDKILFDYQKEIAIGIKNIYRQCYKVFSKTLRQSIENNKKYSFLLYEKKDEDDDFELEMTELYNEMSNEQSIYILNTLKNKILFYSKKANIEYNIQLNEKLKQLNDLQNSIISITAISKIKDLYNEIQNDRKNKIDNVNNILKDLLQNNIVNQTADFIAREEMLNGESITRYKEAEYVNKQIKEEVYAEWNSMHLETSRTTHMEASGQTKKVGELFMVRNPRTFMPEYGKEPKDNNFSLENKINCYCFLIYYLSNIKYII
jgi:hypothetical protein